MNMSKFATLISYITMLANRAEVQCLSNPEVDEIGKLITDLMPVAQQPAIERIPPTHNEIVNVAGKEVAGMLIAMSTPGKKIEAIKACRMLTGLGLKEAKDMIEAAMNCNPVSHAN